MTDRYWHYTVGAYIPAILKDQAIIPASTNFPPGPSRVVWTSSNPVWEETANKGWSDTPDGPIRTLSRDETHQKAGGLWRIEVAPECVPYTFHDYRRLSGLSKPELDALAHFGNSDEWRFSATPIRCDAGHWLALEKWNGWMWIREL